MFSLLKLFKPGMVVRDCNTCTQWLEVSLGCVHGRAISKRFQYYHIWLERQGLCHCIQGPLWSRSFTYICPQTICILDSRNIYTWLHKQELFTCPCVCSHVKASSCPLPGKHLLQLLLSPFCRSSMTSIIFMTACWMAGVGILIAPPEHFASIL